MSGCHQAGGYDRNVLDAQRYCVLFFFLCDDRKTAFVFVVGSDAGMVLSEHVPLKPELDKFCQIGMADSYSDFHIEYGGVSVWYHVVKVES